MGSGLFYIAISANNPQSAVPPSRTNQSEGLSANNRPSFITNDRMTALYSKCATEKSLARIGRNCCSAMATQETIMRFTLMFFRGGDAFHLGALLWAGPGVARPGPWAAPLFCDGGDAT